MKNLLSRESHAVLLLMAGVFIMLLAGASGCSKSVSKCDDDKAIKAVINTVSQDMKKDLAAVAGLGGPGMELSDDEWRTIRAGMVIDLENIREHSFDEAANKRTCAANLMIVQGGKKELIPVTYVSEMNKDTGELKVALSGLQEYKKSQKAPPLPQ
jgi:hypothetical protein